MGIKKKLNDTIFRIKIRKALTDETDEYVRITYEESRKELERRNRKK